MRRLKRIPRKEDPEELLIKRRTLLLIEQLEARLGSERKACILLEIDPSYPKKWRDDPNRMVGPAIFKSLTGRYDVRFFTDPALGAAPDSSRFDLNTRVELDTDADPPFWREFEDSSVFKSLRVSTAEIEHVKRAPFRGGVRGPQDYQNALLAIVRVDSLVRPAAFEHALAEIEPAADADELLPARVSPDRERSSSRRRHVEPARR